MMNDEILKLLRCPKTGASLVFEPDVLDGCDLDSGWLTTPNRQQRYQVRNGIPRFVPQNNYADNFGMQWNHFRRTQLDSHSGYPISADRFWKSTKWTPEDMAGQWVLDAGCGAGRFAEVALNAGAKVVALDYSNAVDACFSNLQHHPNLHVVQGDIYSLPFAPGTFAFVYCFGVLQHTPDVPVAFAALPQMVQKGGRLCVDYYQKTWKSFFHLKYWLRPVTKRLPPDVLFKTVQRTVPVLLPLSRRIGSIPFLGKVLTRLVPVANYYHVLPLSDEQQKDWALLDTFDWLGPQYDHPQTIAAARSWMEHAGMREIEVLKLGHLVARGKR